MWGLAAANAVSMAGTRLSQIAVPWLVLTTTGSASAAGIAAFAQLVPLVLVQALGGPMVDRVGARKVAIWSDVASTLAVVAIPLLHTADALTFPVLLILVAAAGLARGPADIGHHALIPEVVKHTGQPTARITGLIGTTDGLADLAGAALSGVVIAAVGPVNALYVDAASFLISATVLAATTRRMQADQHASPGKPPCGPTVPKRATYLQELREGLSFLLGDRLLLGIVLTVAVTNMLDQGHGSVLLPVWAQHSGHGPGAIGLLSACFGGAALAASAIATWLGPRLPRFPVYLVGFLLAAAPRYVAIAIELPMPWIVAVTLVCGFGAGFLNPILGALQFERIPDHLMGRVSATSLAATWMLMPLGGLLAGYLTTHVGLTVALLTFAAAYVITVTLPALNSEWRTGGRQNCVR